MPVWAELLSEKSKTWSPIAGHPGVQEWRLCFCFQVSGSGHLLLCDHCATGGNHQAPWTFKLWGRQWWSLKSLTSASAWCNCIRIKSYLHPFLYWGEAVYVRIYVCAHAPVCTCPRGGSEVNIKCPPRLSFTWQQGERPAEPGFS